ncbi:MAG: sulfatase [Thermoanaerobaculia bacterium]
MRPWPALLAPAHDDRKSREQPLICPLRWATSARWALFCVLVAASVGCGPREPARSLIIICIDTLRADHLHSYGYERDTSPAIDALAGEGTRFDRALSTSNWTVPSVASVFTSVLPSRHGAGVPGAVKNLDKDPPTPIAPGLLSLTDILKAQGFRTGLFSANPFLYGSFKRSFDEAVVTRVSGAELADAAIGWISQHPEERSFLYVQFMDAHHPNLPPEPYFERFATPAAGAREKRHSGWSYGRLADAEDPAFLAFRENRLAVYDGSLRYVDDQVGRLLQRIEKLGILQDAVVVVYADHGEEFWDHAQEESSQQDDPRGLWGIGHGHSMFQELLGVPLIVRRGDRPAKAAVDCPVSLLDIAPTSLAMLGLETPASMEGRNLSGLIDGTEECSRRAIAAESPAYGPDSAAIVEWPLKLVRRGEKTTLYNLADDPGERHDLSAAQPRAVQQLEVALDRLLSARVASDAASRVDPETLQQLRALGYLGN